MTSLASTTGLTRATSLLPDVAAGWREDEPIPPSPEAALRQVQFDAAVEINRRGVPQAVVDQRRAPRYSLRQLNSLDDDAIAQRIQALDPGDNRPGWVKALDLIDMPRNFVAGAITSHFLPEAKRRAMERGEFDQAGQVKVYGADMLRAMGVENRVVNAVGGFLVDVVTDPLSWVGGPLGGLKTAGTAGTVRISNAGQRALRGGLKAFAAGKPIADDATRRVIESAVAAGRAAGEIDDAADAAALARYARETLLGRQGAVSRGAERVGLGGSTRGGAIAEDVYRSRRAATSAEEAARIDAVKGFVARYTNNRGLDMTGGRAGAEILHVPMTDRTLTVPTFRVPALGITPGKAAVIQRAVAAAQDGDMGKGTALVAAQRSYEEAKAVADRMQSLLDERAALTTKIAAAGMGGEPSLFTSRLEDLAGEIVGEGARLDSVNEGIAARLDVVLNGLRGAVQTPETIDDLLLAAELQRKAFAEAKRAAAMARWRSVDDLVARAEQADVEAARRAKRRIADEVRALTRLDPEATVDEVLTVARQDDALRQLVEARAEQAGVRVQRLIDLSDDNLDLAESVADAFHAVVDSASEVASLSGVGVRSAMNSEQRMIADVARQVLRVNDREMGNLPFAAFERAALHMGQLDAAATIADRGNRVGRSLGGVSGILPQAMGAYRRQIDLAETQAADVARQFRGGYGAFEGMTGLDGILHAHGLPKRALGDIDALVQMRVEAAMRAGRGVPSPVMATHPGSAAATLRQRLADQGVLQNAELMADVDRLAARTIELYRTMGEEAVRRGDFDNPLAPYAPVQLTGRAATRLKTLSETGQPGPLRSAATDLMDTGKARNTNIVEFVGSDGNPSWFLVQEALVFGRMTDAELARVAEEAPEAAERMRRVRDAVADYAARYADGMEIEDAVREASRPLLPFELNELAARGIFDTMVGGRILDQGAIFETSAMHLLSRRVKADLVAEAEDGFRQAVEPFILVRQDLKQLDALRPGDETRLATGQRVRNLGHRRFDVGGRIYRPLELAGRDPESFFIPEMVYGPGISEALIPDTLATAIERMNDTLNPRNIGPILGMVDRVTSVWKVNTLSHLSWPIANTVGSVVLTAMEFPDLLTTKAPKFTRHAKDAVKIIAQRNTGGRLNREMATVSLGGTPVPVRDVIAMADALGVMTQGLSGDVMQQLMRSTSSSRPVGDAAISAGPMGGMRDRYRRAAAEYLDARGDLPPSQTARRVDQMRAGAKAFTKGPLESVTRAWFGVNGGIDDTFRLALFMHLLDEGWDAVSAGQKVRRTLLNFGDMTSLERNVIRPLVPFYAWTRASLPNMLMRAFADPKQIAAVPKVGQAFEELLAGEGRVPRWKRPRWLQETMAMQIGTNPETASTLQLGTLLPQEAAISAGAGVLGAAGLAGFDGQDFLDSMNWALGQLGPVAKAPFELGTGRESFTGRTIGPEEGDADVTLPQYLAGQIRWLRETGVGAPGDGPVQRAFDRGTGAGVGRLVVGGRLAQNIDSGYAQSALRGELKEAETELRKAISRADRRGDAEAGTELRTRLVELYFNHLRRGGDPQDVPKWARDDLEALGVGDELPVTQEVEL